MLFSIIVPVYNVEKYLSECLDSILNQKYDGFEIICIDDCSTDGSWAILEKYAQKYTRIKLLRNETNRGSSYCRNRGIANANGEYVWFVDSDDYIVADALSVLADTVSSNLYDAVFFGFFESYESTKETDHLISTVNYNPAMTHLSISGREFFFRNLKEYINNSPWNVVWNAIYKKKILDIFGLRFKEGIYSEDWLFRLQFAFCESRVIGINNRLYVYRRRNGSVSMCKTSRHAHSCCYILQKMFEIWQEKSLSDEEEIIMRKYCVYVYRTMMKYLAYQKRTDEYEMESGPNSLLWQMVCGNCYSFLPLKKEQWDDIEEADGIWIYGAGNIGCEFAKYILNNNVDFKGFIVSNKEENVERVLGHGIFAYKENLVKSNDIVVIAVSDIYKAEIINRLQNIGVRKIELEFD